MVYKLSILVDNGNVVRLFGLFFSIFGKEVVMQNKLIDDDFINIIGDIVNGNNQNIEMRLRLIIKKLKPESPDLASKLSSLINKKNNSLRNDVTFSNKIIPVDSDSRQKLLIEEYPVIIKNVPIWSDEIKTGFLRFINEREQSELLLNNDVMPSKSLLMAGPPGVGKTLGAHWLASKLDLPLLTLDLATVMSSYLGKTGSNIRAVLDYARSFPCVLLLDEFDSIAKKRDDISDVGELKRLVTVLLQAIDSWPHTSVLVAATNHGELLDTAVWRRFDKVIEFELPDKSLIKMFVEKFGIHNKIIDSIVPFLEGKSFAIIERILNQAKKNSILEDTTISAALIDELGMSKNKNEIIRDCVNNGISQRQTAKEFGMARATIKKAL